MQRLLRLLGLWLWLCSTAAIPSMAHAHAGDATAFASVTLSDASIRYTYTPTSASSADPSKLPLLLRQHLQVNADGKPCVPDQKNELVIVFQCVTAKRQISVEDHLDQVLGASNISRPAMIIYCFCWC